MIANNRLGIGRGRSQATSNLYQYFVSKIFFGTPNWVVKNPKFLFSNIYSAAGIMTNPGNVLNLEKAAIWVGGSFLAAINIAGSRAYTLADGQSIWSDALSGVSLPANTIIEIRVAGNVALNAYQVGNIYGVNTAIGEGFGTNSVSQASKVDSGTVSAIDGTFGGGGAFTANAMIGQGWDGKPVSLLLGDSIGFGNNIAPILSDARGNVSGITMALDSSTNGRIPMWNTAMFSANMNVVKNIGSASTLSWVKACCDLLGSVPFTSVVNQLGINDAGSGLSSFQTIENALIANIQTYFPGVKYYNTTLTAETNGGTNLFWTDEANQTWPQTYYGPDPCARSQENTWRKSVPTGVQACLDGASAIYGTDTSKYLSAVTSALLTSSITANTSFQFQVDTAPQLGTFAVFEPGDATNADGASYEVYAVTGTGPYTVSVKNGGGNSNKNIVKAHASGTVVKFAITNDGIHPGGYGHGLMATAYVNAKTAII
jgi:lysophospholipase L1-like esterase